MTETKPGDVTNGIDAATELRRIMTTGLLSAVLLIIAAILDGPVSILAWLLLASALLCLVYVVIASRNLSLHVRSLDHKADTND